MTGTAGLNDTTIATSSAAHASTAHGHGDPTPPREAAPPVVRAGASRSDRTIAVHTGSWNAAPASCWTKTPYKTIGGHGVLPAPSPSRQYARLRDMMVDACTNVASRIARPWSRLGRR